MDQSCKATNSARDQLNREHEYFPIPVRACRFGLVRGVRPSRLASAFSFSILRLNLVLAHEIPPDFRVRQHYLYKKDPVKLLTNLLSSTAFDSP